MQKKKFSRRDFIRAGSVAAGAGLIAACTPQTVVQTQIVQQTSVVRETELVTVKETEIVSQVVTATPLPTAVPEPAVMEIWAIHGIEDLNEEWEPTPENGPFTEQGEGWAGGIIRAQARAFLKEHPDVTLNITGHGWDSGLRQNIYLAIAAGLTPDTSYGEGYVSEFASLGLFNAVSDEVAALHAQSTHRATMKDGKAYGLAETSGANVLFINLDVLEKVGLDPEVMPTNWDELLTMADTISKGNGGNAYFTYTPAPEGFWIAFRMAHWWAQAGVPIGTDLGVPTFNTPGAADVWLFHNQLMNSTPVDTMLLINAKGEGPAASGLSFDDGDIALKAGWNNDATYIVSNARAIQFPTPPGGKKASILIGNQINSPFKDGPNPELAIEYIEITTTDIEAQTIKPNGVGVWLPTLKSLLEMREDANFLGGYPEKAHPNVWVTMDALLDDGSGSLPGWPKNSPRIWTAWNDAYNKIWTGNLDKAAIQAELDTLQTTAEGLLAATA